MLFSLGPPTNLSNVLATLNKSIESVTENVLHIERRERFHMIVTSVLIPLGASAVIIVFLAAMFIIICGGVLLRFVLTYPKPLAACVSYHSRKYRRKRAMQQSNTLRSPFISRNSSDNEMHISNLDNLYISNRAKKSSLKPNAAYYHTKIQISVKGS